ncbi:LytTR family DNA-binding domain-containing protein [Dyadobacter sp. CY323]|uniref:LytR/AlgR family response regulator transcription factor n=1 Tax=Dyadobacter sp. CY323 TaxID=2907302 RepID=UPI001F2D5F1A|nr:LytTR family DNA-binding domain-containing protein [Dyadobacter sp. CY323]MCE6991026.1 LytTR family DNA-binding domain-containing protein [Dyadobacter sp. CY323]
MIKALIVDDEPKARNILDYYIENFIEDITEVRQAESVDAALEILKTYRPSIVFLDVEMPRKNGFDFLRSIKEPTFEVVFTTAYNHYAVQAIRFSALDYLLKPVDPDELKAAVERFKKKMLPDDQNRVLFNNLVDNMSKGNPKDFRLAIPSKEGVFFLTIDQIVRMQGDGNYTFIHLKEKRPIVTSKTLKYYEEMLDEFGFIRTHKSHLVNPLHIVKLAPDRDCLMLSDGSQVEISRRKKEDVIEMLKIP